MAQVTFNTRISIETSQDLDKLAAKLGKSKAAIVEEALRTYIEKHLQKNQK